MGGKIRGFNVSPDWLLELTGFIQHLFTLADDDLNGCLSLREFKSALIPDDAKQKMLALGLEVCHQDALFKEIDHDGSGEISLIEAIHGFARIKERLQND